MILTEPCIKNGFCLGKFSDEFSPQCKSTEPKTAKPQQWGYYDLDDVTVLANTQGDA